MWVFFLVKLGSRSCSAGHSLQLPESKTGSLRWGQQFQHVYGAQCASIVGYQAKSIFIIHGVISMCWLDWLLRVYRSAEHLYAFWALLRWKPNDMKVRNVLWWKAIAWWQGHWIWRILAKKIEPKIFFGPCLDFKDMDIRVKCLFEADVVFGLIYSGLRIQTRTRYPCKPVCFCLSPLRGTWKRNPILFILRAPPEHGIRTRILTRIPNQLKSIGESCSCPRMWWRLTLSVMFLIICDSIARRYVFTSKNVKRLTRFGWKMSLQKCIGPCMLCERRCATKVGFYSKFRVECCPIDSKWLPSHPSCLSDINIVSEKGIVFFFPSWHRERA